MYFNQNQKSLKPYFLKSVLGFMICSLFSLVAKAQTNPTYLKWNGEYRTRYELLTHPDADSSSTLNTFSHRLIVNSSFQPHENIEIKASLLLTENLGQTYRGYAGYDIATSSQNTVHIYELYANWLASSGLGFQLGRFLYKTANDNIFSYNLDDANPTRFDGGLLKYDKDFFNFEGGAFIVSQFQDLNLKTETSMLYLVNVNLSIDQTFLKSLNLSFISYDTKEKTFVELNNYTFPEQSLTMYTISLNGEYEWFYYNADSVLQEGDNVTANQLVDSSMMNVLLGVNIDRSSSFKTYVQFHRDTGDKSSTSDKDESYNPMFYNHFINAGRMKLIGWGNLKTFSFGITRKWREMKATLEYTKFYRTSADAGLNGLSANGITPLVLDNSGTNSGPYNNILNSDQMDVGDEIDLVIDFTNEIGLKFQSITGLFFHGNYLKDYGKDSNIFYQRLGVEFTF